MLLKTLQYYFECTDDSNLRTVATGSQRRHHCVSRHSDWIHQQMHWRCHRTPPHTPAKSHHANQRFKKQQETAYCIASSPQSKWKDHFTCSWHVWRGLQITTHYKTTLHACNAPHACMWGRCSQSMQSHKIRQCTSLCAEGQLSNIINRLLQHLSEPVSCVFVLQSHHHQYRRGLEWQSSIITAW